MKRITLYILSVAALLNSCSALEETPSSFAQRENWYKTEIQCRTAVNGCYHNLHNVCSPIGLFMAVEGVSDLYCTNYANMDAMLDISPSYNGIAQTVWTNCYQGIMRCNDVIYSIENLSPLPDEMKMPYAAEARVMRAYYYYFLTNVFNGVPFYLYYVDSKETMDKIRDLGRTPANEIRSVLRDDLEQNALPWFTKENGLKRRTSEIEGNRAGYALALMLMAKFDMWMEDYNHALNGADGNKGPLKLLEELYGSLTEANYPLGDIRWSIKNTDESIFELQNEYNTSGIMYFSKWAYVAQPAKNASATGAGGTYDDSYMGWYFGSTVIGSEPLRANTYYASFMPAGGNVATENMSARYQNGLLNPLPLKVSSDSKDYQPELGRRKVVIDKKAIEPDEDGKYRRADGKLVDRRVFYKLGIFGRKDSADGALVLFNQVVQNGRPWAGPQFWRQGQLSNADGNNYKLLRYADAVLMTAECYCRLGELEKAQEYLNFTRARAGVEPLDYSSQDDMLSNILDERARELGGELHRKWDLVRWGIWYDRVKQYSESANGLKSNLRKYHEYYPIPDVECSLSKYALTNDEYAK